MLPEFKCVNQYRHSVVLCVMADCKSFKIFLYSVKESERVIATIVFFFLLISAIRRAQLSNFDFSLFTVFFFSKGDSTKVQLLSLQGNGLENESCCAWLHAWIIDRR